MIEGDAVRFQARHQTIEQYKAVLLRCQLAQLVIAEETDMQDHPIAAQAEQPLDRLPFVFCAVASLSHQQLLAMGFCFGLHEVHQRAEETAAI
ncbi:hypothetical protein D3C87_2032610 [compost metagenome]